MAETDGTRVPRPIHGAHDAPGRHRRAGVMRWDAWLVTGAGESGAPGLVCPECVDPGHVVVVECPLIGDETAEFVRGRCEAPIRKAEAVLYP